MSEEIHTANDSQGNEGFYDPISKQAYINGILYKILPVSTEGEAERRCRVASVFCIPHTKDLVFDYIEVDGERYNVLYLPDLAFSDCDQLESVVLGDSVHEIGCGAFSFCPNLKRFVSGNSLTFIPIDCFAGDTSLTEVDLNDKITTIEYSAFNSCVALEELQLPKSLKEIHANAFYNCASLKKVSLPDGVLLLPHSAFACCNLLEEVTIGASERFRVYDDALAWCSNLKTVYSNTPRKKIKVLDYHKSVGLSGPAHHKRGTYPWDYNHATFIYTGKTGRGADECCAVTNGNRQEVTNI